MTNERRLRISAVLGFGYVALYIALQVILPQMLGGDSPPNQTNLGMDQSVATLLRFVANHSAYFSIGYVLVAVNYMLLLGPAYGCFLLARIARPTLALVALLIGVGSITGIIGSQIVAAHQWIDWATAYRHAPTAARQLLVIHGFENGVGAYQIGLLISLTGLALWLSLLGVNLLNIFGMRNLAGWGSIATALLMLLQLPVLPVWSFAAAIGLVRLAGTAVSAGVEPRPVIPGATTAVQPRRDRKPSPERGPTSATGPRSRPTAKRKRR